MEITGLFQPGMDGGDRMGGIGAEEAHEVTPGMAGDHRIQHRLQAIGAVDVAGTQGAAFQHAKPVEQKQRMVAKAVGNARSRRRPPARHGSD